MLSDSNKRAVYDQVGEEGLKGGRPAPGAGSSGGFSGFPSGSSFTFTSGPGGFHSSTEGFAPTDPQKIFECVSYFLLLLVLILSLSSDISSGTLSFQVEEQVHRCSIST